MSNPAIHDFFRKIKLISPDGSTVQSTLEADSVTDELTLSASEGIAFVPDANTDSVKLDIDYNFYSPVGTTKLRLEDINNNVKDVNLRGGLGVTIARAASDDIVFSSYSVAEIDTLQSVTARGFISGEDLVVNNLTVGKVNSLAGIDGMSAQDSRFTGDGTLYTPLRIDPAEAEVTTATYSETFTFSTAAADGVLTYAVAYDNPVNVSTASMVLEREDPNNPGTWITLESITNPTAGAYVAANNYSEAYDGSVNYRLVFNFTGNTDTIILTGEFSYEVLDIAEDPALQTDSANEKVTVRNFENIGVHETNDTNLTNLYDLKLKNLTQNRIVFSTTDGKLVDSANLQFDTGTNTLSVINLSVSGDMTLGGTITIGDGAGDTIDFAAGTSSNFLPAETNTYTIGTSALQWQAGHFYDLFVNGGEIYGGPINTDDIRIAGNRIETTASNANFEVGVNGTGNIQLLAETTISGNTTINETISTTDPALTVNGDTNLTGELLINGNVFVKTFDSNNNYGLGADSLSALTSGISNVSLGYETLVNTTTGSNNTIIGYRSGKVIAGGTGNTSLGTTTLSGLTSGNYNTALGYNAGSSIISGGNNIIIGNSAAASTTTTSNEITLGNGNISRFRIPGLGIDYQATTAFKIPAGTGDPDEAQGTSLNQRPTGSTGAIRYNSTKGVFEGYNGADWIILNGLQDQDQDTYISVNTDESASPTDDDTLTFVNRGNTTATLSPNSLVFSNAIPVNIPNTNTTLAIGQGALVVGGGASIAGNLIVGGEIINANIQSENSLGVEGTTSGSSTTDVVVSADAIDSFKEGNYVRIYRASANSTAQSNTGLGLTLGRVGFTTPGGGDTVTDFNYRVAQFDFTTGKSSAAESAVSISVLTSEVTSFNNTNNIQLTLARETTGKGILIYRKVGLEIDFKLIAVLGPKELGTGTGSILWTDYYDYDYTPWSQKGVTNTFETSSGVIHFPITPPSTSILGWFDTRVDSVDTNTNTITVEDTFDGEANVWIYKDDTIDVQTQIDINVNTNINVLELDARIYYISSLSIPENFSLYGAGEQTQLIKLPWSIDLDNNTNEMLTPGNPTTSNRVSISQMYINGNAQNQYLVDDEINEYVNYAIRMIGEDMSIQNIELTNLVGGGIWMFDNTLNTLQVSVYQNQINSGCLSYRYEYSPLNVTQGKSVRVTQNSFEGFPNYVDFSAVEKGVISNNIVDNCGSGIFGFGVINTILNPNVLVGPAGEFIPNPDVLNSEFDSVNIKLESGVDFTSPSVVYQESGFNFDLSANQGFLSSAINELKKINGVETISTDYTTTTGGTNYISFLSAPTVDPTEGELKFRIQQSLVNDLLSRANYETLYANDTNTLGLIYRIFTTEYVPLTNLVLQDPVTNSDQGGGVYRVEVEDTSGFNENDVVRLVGHSTTPSLATRDGTIVAINNVTKLIDIDFGIDVTSPASDGQLALKNTFVVVKGKIN